MLWAEMTSSYLFYQVHSGCYIENSLEEGKGGSREACERVDGDSEQGEAGIEFWIYYEGRAINQYFL